MNVCDYGCGLEGKFQFKNGKWCCHEYASQCPKIRQKNSEFRKGKTSQWKNGHPKGCLGKTSPRKGKTYEEIFGVEKAKKVRKKLSIASRKSKKPRGRGKTKKAEQERRRKLSELINERYKNGWMPKAGRCKKFKYSSHIAGKVNLDGTWELEFAKFLDDCNVSWKRNKKKFSYQFKNKKRKYTPDFYINDKNIGSFYIEVKGYETDKDRAKWEYFPHKLIIIKRSKINKIKAGQCTIKDLLNWKGGRVD